MPSIVRVEVMHIWMRREKFIRISSVMNLQGIKNGMVNLRFQ